MKNLEFESREEWEEARKGMVTGTRLGDILPKKDGSWKKGVWQMIAENVAEAADGENPMERGLRLEDEAIERFEKETGKKVKRGLTLCVSSENKKMGYSSDGIISASEDVEVKCLNSASHIEAWYTKEIPSDYYYQRLQGFIVNPKLMKRHFVFYDPRVPAKDFFFFTVTREDCGGEIETYKEEQLKILAEVERITNELINF